MSGGILKSVLDRKNECAAKPEEYMPLFHIDILDKFVATSLKHNETTRNDPAIIFLKMYGKIKKWVERKTIGNKSYCNGTYNKYSQSWCEDLPDMCS